MDQSKCRNLASLLLVLMFAGSAIAAEQPNIVFIFSDDHAPNAIGAYDGWLKSVNAVPVKKVNCGRLEPLATIGVHGKPVVVYFRLVNSRTNTQAGDVLGGDRMVTASN